jgi:NAD(P)-dependent dehydrogenase (short-subunit alcohol dehydrogenase family)
LSYSNNIRFDDRVVIVTGAQSGVGRDLAIELAARGAAVVACQIPQPLNEGAADATSTAQTIVIAGGQALDSSAEITTAAGAKALVAECLCSFGRVDALICAPDLAEAGSHPIPSDPLAALFGFVVGATFNVSQAAWPAMCDRGYGRIVVVGSGAGLLYADHRHNAAMHAVTGSLAGMTRALSSEGPDRGVHVNTVVPVPDSLPTANDNGTVRATADATTVAAALWLAHEGCHVSGRYFAAGRGRIAEIFTSAGTGYQCPNPSSFSLEDVRNNWHVATDPGGAICPENQVEYNAFRVSVYRAAVE